MDNYKATPAQWSFMEGSAGSLSSSACLLELRARVEALEAQAGNLKGSLTSSTPPPVAGGLMVRVAHVIDTGSGEAEARAAILEVARWLREQGFVIDSDLLEQEAGR